VPALELADVAIARHAVAVEHAAQKPEELELLLEWFRSIAFNPRAVLEVGVYLGGTLALWRRLWPHARLIGVDLSPGPCPPCEERRAHRDCPRRRISEALGGWPNGRLLVGDSHEQSSRDRVASWLPAIPDFGCDFLLIDGDHSAAGVRRDFELYAPLVRAGGAIVLHDVAGDAFPGVVELWGQLAESEPAAFLILAGREDWGGLGVIPR